MTTPSVMGSVINSLRQRLNDAQRDCRKLHDDPRAEGYDDGFRDAIKEILQEITGEPQMETYG